MENDVVSEQTGESFADASTITNGNSTGSDSAISGLELPLRKDRDAPQDLDLVSWPPRKRLPLFDRKMKWYTYDIERGLDTYIYIIDTGLNPDNAVRTPILTTISFLSNKVLGVQIGAVVDTGH